MQFWQMMGPGQSDMPSELEKALVDSFGSVDAFKDEFKAAGAGQFRSGWCWLVKNAEGGLQVTKTENGVNPLCFGQTALLGCDVWEHSYYIDFRNKRPDIWPISLRIWSIGNSLRRRCSFWPELLPTWLVERQHRFKSRPVLPSGIFSVMI